MANFHDDLCEMGDMGIFMVEVQYVRLTLLFACAAGSQMRGLYEQQQNKVYFNKTENAGSKEKICQKG